jgi:hypothetical protein
VSSLYFEGETDTFQYLESFRSFADASLSVPESAKLISDVSRRAWS